MLDTIADRFSTSQRSPVLSSPAQHGLDFEDVTFPSEDGTSLEGWFVPTPGSDRIVILNHPRFFSRSGLPSHLEPWQSVHRETGNDIEVDLIPDIALLHAAGYHVLAYDLRNFGLSGTANGGVTTGGRFESRDVVGSLRYVRSRHEGRGIPAERMDELDRLVRLRTSFGLDECPRLRKTQSAAYRYPRSFTRSTTTS